MKMTTTAVQKLLDLATRYEKRAEALRLAAGELIGPQVEQKHDQLAATLSGALKLRAAQQAAAANGNGHRPVLTAASRWQRDREARRQIVLDALAEGPTTILALAEALQAGGHAIQRDRVRQFLKEAVPEATHHGGAHKSLWMLKAGRAAHHPTKPRTPAQRRAADAARKRVARGRTRPPKDQALAKAHAVVDLVRQAGRPVSTKELVVTARAAGIASLTGMYNYVKAGYLSASGKPGPTMRYAFKAMPPEAQATT